MNRFLRDSVKFTHLALHSVAILLAELQISFNYFTFYHVAYIFL